MTVEPQAGNEHAGLLRYRDDFDQLSQQTYLNNCSLGPLSHQVEAAGRAYFDSWRQHGGRAWYAHDGWLEKIGLAKARFATLIGAQPHEIAVAPNVSTALAAVTSALTGRKRNSVVTTELDFPSMVHQFLAREPLGLHCNVLRSLDGIGISMAQFEHALDQRTALLATSRVFYSTGAIQDVAALAQLAHAHGALLLVDDYQASGQIPVDVKKMDVDMLLSGSIKWLLGGPGLAFAYVREDLIERLEPTVVGWFGHQRQLDFVPSPWEPRDTAARFELGTPSLSAIYTALAGLDLILEADPTRIRSRMVHLVSQLVALLQARDFKLKIHPDARCRSAIVMVECPQLDAMVQALLRQFIVVDARPGHIRISPYFFNTVEELHQVADAMAGIRDGLLRSNPAN